MLTDVGPVEIAVPRDREGSFEPKIVKKRQKRLSGVDVAALKCVYMAIMSLDPTGKGQARWTMRWKTALNSFDITFDGRLSAAFALGGPSFARRGAPSALLLGWPSAQAGDRASGGGLVR